MPAAPSPDGAGDDQTYAEILTRRRIEVRCVVVLTSASTPSSRVDELAAEFPDARIHVLSKGRPDGSVAARWDDRVIEVQAGTNAQRLAYLRGIERPQLALDAGGSRAAQSVHALQHLYFHLAPGGLFAIERAKPLGPDEAESSFTVLAAAAGLARVEGDLDARKPVEPRLEIRATSATTTFSGDRAVVGKSAGPEGHHLLKLRDWEADEALTTRYGAAWGRTLLTRPASTFQGRGEVTNHGVGPFSDGALSYEVPELHLREYASPVCSPRQVLTFGDYVLPDTWRHPHQGVLNSITLITSTRHFARFKPQAQTGPPRELRGSYYYLDTMMPGHFGHVTTEVLGRVWGWRHAVRADPDVRALVSQQVVGDFHPFQRMIFDALGIPSDRTELIGPAESVRVERLFGASPEFENPTYVAPELAEVVERLADGLPPAAVTTGEKVFVSRRPADKRHCLNTAEVERFFADQGFDVIYPEDRSYPEQKALFAHARIIAGFGGSGMFTMMFAPRARVIVIASRNYNAQNERLFAALNGNDLHYVWGDPEIEAPLNTYRREAFRSPFRVNLRRHRRALRRLSR